MGYRDIELKLPTDYRHDQLLSAIAGQVKTRDFTYHLHLKSLDARDKRRIFWRLNVGVTSGAIPGGIAPPAGRSLSIPFRPRKQRALVAGSGPAGYFAALVLQRAGFVTTLIERGSEVEDRAERIAGFERTGVFDPLGNYAFGEGGAGTFSDGKLTSRSKRIGPEKLFILSSYVEAGGPQEILHLNHPHLGSDNLRHIVANLRNRFMEDGGRFLFDTMLTDLRVDGGKVVSAETSRGIMDADLFFIAPGHSAYETHRMLMRRGVTCVPKNSALGSRVEHPQVLINRAQWGVESLPGVKAAEYRLTSRGDGSRPVYTFCMCPGGTVVPATAYEDASIVNGMSQYLRDSPYANSACVAGITPEGLWGGDASAAIVLESLENLEHRFKEFSNDFRAPACTIKDFISGRAGSTLPESSYPHGLVEAPLWEMLPPQIVPALRAGLKEFAGKITGFDSGLMLGLESKTSSVIRSIRDVSGRCAGFENLWIVGEGGGYAGGIISSGADGIKAAMSVAISG